jgi:hypothetical protein
MRALQPAGENALVAIGAGHDRRAQAALACLGQGSGVAVQDLVVLGGRDRLDEVLNELTIACAGQVLLGAELVQALRGQALGVDLGLFHLAHALGGGDVALPGDGNLVLLGQGIGDPPDQHRLLHARGRGINAGLALDHLAVGLGAGLVARLCALVQLPDRGGSVVAR